MVHKESFVFYKTFYEAASTLDDKSFRELITKLCKYGFEGIDEPSDNPNVNMAMLFCKDSLDRAEQKRQAQINNGKKGGAPKGNTNAKKQPNSTQNNPIQANSTQNNLNVNDNVNDNENGNGKENENGNGTGIGPISSNPEKEKDGKEIGLTTSTSIDYKEKEELDNPIVSPSDSLYSNVGNNTGKTSNEYYQTIKGSDNSISIVDYAYEELSKLEELMVEKYKLTNRDFDNEYWEMFNTCVGYLQELGEYNNEEARKKLNDMLNDLYKYKKNEQFAQPVIPVPSFKD